MMDVIHILPVNDYVEHCQKGRSCQCGPFALEVDGGVMVVHNSWDGRELYERARADETLPDYPESDIEFCLKAIQDERLNRYAI